MDFIILFSKKKTRLGEISGHQTAAASVGPSPFGSHGQLLALSLPRLRGAGVGAADPSSALGLLAGSGLLQGHRLSFLWV